MSVWALAGPNRPGARTVLAEAIELTTSFNVTYLPTVILTNTKSDKIIVSPYVVFVRVVVPILLPDARTVASVASTSNCWHIGIAWALADPEMADIISTEYKPIGKNTDNVAVSAAFLIGDIITGATVPSATNAIAVVAAFKLKSSYLKTGGDGRGLF